MNRAHALSTPNIALIKYWGNRNNELRLPAADSLSMTLDRPTVEVSLERSKHFSLHSFEANGLEKILTEKNIQRFRETLSLMQTYLESLGAPKALHPDQLSIEIHSHIPPSVGLASSAAVFSCLAKAVQGLIREDIALLNEQTSVLARLGSGSAARSIFGGFSALVAGTGDDIGSSVAVQVADSAHWTLWDIVIIPSTDEKKVGSTEGHAIAATSPHFAKRISDINTYRQRECIDAVMQRDFEKLRAMSEEDSLDMHHVMETSTPELHYLTKETHRIIGEIESLRKQKRLPVLYTMDAGPTVHLICEETALADIRAYAEIQKKMGCLVFEAKTGNGAKLL